MSAFSVSPPFPTFTDIDGSPLEDGYIFIGAANQNPEAVPIPAFWDAALTIPAAQPIRTIAGYPSRSGAPARPYVDADDYSTTVRNKNNIFVYTAASNTERLTSAQLTGSIDSSRVDWARTTLSTAIATVGGMLSAQWRNVWEYAGLVTVKPDVEDPSTWDWQPAIQALVDSGAGVGYFPGPMVYNTESTVIVDKPIRLLADQAKRLGSPVGTRIFNTGSGDAVIYSNTAAIYDAGIENLGISAANGHALNIKYGAVRCHFKQLYLYTQHTGRSCVAGIYNTGTPGVDYIGTYSSVFEGGEYIVDNVARVAPIVDFLANGTLVNENCFRNLWVTNSKGRPAIRLMATTPGVYLTNNSFDGITAEVCSGGVILLQANSHTRISGLSAWDTPAGYDTSLIVVSNDSSFAQTRGLLIENYGRISSPLNGAAVDIDLGFSLSTTIINHSSTVVGKIEFRNRSCVVIGAVNATVTNDAATAYVSGGLSSFKGMVGFFGKAPVTQPSASPDTTGATLAQLEAIVNQMKQNQRDLGLMAT